MIYPWSWQPLNISGDLILTKWSSSHTYGQNRQNITHKDDVEDLNLVGLQLKQYNRNKTNLSLLLYFLFFLHFYVREKWK